MRYADSKDVLKKSHNLASESEATVLLTSDSAFIKISCTPRSAVPPDKRSARDLYCFVTVKSLLSQSLRDIASSTKSFHFYIPLPSHQPPKYAAWICQRVGSSREAVSDQVFRIYLHRVYFSARQAFRRKKISRVLHRAI